MSKLIKVIFEYEDRISTLEEDAQEWLEEINSFVAQVALRLGTKGMSEYNWKDVKKDVKTKNKKDTSKKNKNNG